MFDKHLSTVPINDTGYFLQLIAQHRSSSKTACGKLRREYSKQQVEQSHAVLRLIFIVTSGSIKTSSLLIQTIKNKVWNQREHFVKLGTKT